MRSPFRITRATVEQMPLVIGLIEEAAGWLKTKGTDQWASPWPSRDERDERIKLGLASGKTYLVWDRDRPDGPPAATVTLDSEGNPVLWDAEELCDTCVYLHRLVVARAYKDRDLGTQLIAWSGAWAARTWDAREIRIDVWTHNAALHGYYKERGFEFIRNNIDFAVWPAGCLFSRAIREPVHKPVPETGAPLFEEAFAQEFERPSHDSGLMSSQRRS